MSDLRTLIRSAPLVLDGAWGTELHGLGLEPGACPDACNLTHPERVTAVARSYVEAGSQIVLTNTFGANRMVLARYGMAGRVREINRAGARLSIEAGAGKAHVVASMGPTGTLLSAGDVGAAELSAVFEEQATALAEGGADAAVLETFADLQELGVALEAVRRAGLFAIACMVFDSGARKDCSATGTTPEQAVKYLSDRGADVIGANCGRGIEAYVPICKRMRAATHLPLWFKPNAGSPRLVEGRTTYDVTAEQFASGAKDLVAAGANLVGGCCGTNPGFIRAIVRALGSG